MISYEKLEVYQLSLSCIEQCIAMSVSLPKGYSDLNSQLKRAVFSVALNIAEGAGKSAKPDKRRYYDIARGSAMETAAICDVIFRLGLLPTEQHRAIKKLLHRIISMLSKLSINLERQNVD